MIAGRGEDKFAAMLAAMGFHVRSISTEQLHEEYRGGEYTVLRACRLGPAVMSDAQCPPEPNAT